MKQQGFVFRFFSFLFFFSFFKNACKNCSSIQFASTEVTSIYGHRLHMYSLFTQRADILAVTTLHNISSVCIFCACVYLLIYFYSCVCVSERGREFDFFLQEMVVFFFFFFQCSYVVQVNYFCFVCTSRFFPWLVASLESLFFF